MQSLGLSWREVLFRIEALRGQRLLDAPYILQLRIWQSCSYDVYERRDGRPRPKRPYMDWLESMVEHQSQTQVNRYCQQS